MQIMGIHEGHRERLRTRFLENGLDSFHEINALELLLFYAIPRRDTNVIAHQLLDRFGTLQGVFEASQQELCEVPGIGPQAAALILLVPQLMRKSAVSRTKEITRITRTSDAGRYLLPRLQDEKVEVVLMLCLDSKRNIINCTEMGRGVVNSTETSIRRIVETALKSKAVSVILAHNHPDGLALPSTEDDAVTHQVNQALSLIGIRLLDHIIVAGDDYVSYRDSGFLYLDTYSG